MLTLQRKKMSKLNEETKTLRTGLLGRLLHHCSKITLIIEEMVSDYELIKREVDEENHYEVIVAVENEKQALVDGINASIKQLDSIMIEVERHFR